MFIFEADSEEEVCEVLEGLPLSGRGHGRGQADASPGRTARPRRALGQRLVAVASILELGDCREGQLRRTPYVRSFVEKN